MSFSISRVTVFGLECYITAPRASNAGLMQTNAVGTSGTRNADINSYITFPFDSNNRSVLVGAVRRNRLNSQGVLLNSPDACFLRYAY